MTLRPQQVGQPGPIRVGRLIFGPLPRLFDAAVEAISDEKERSQLRQADFTAGNELEDFLDLIEVATGNEWRDELACFAYHCRGEVSPLLRVLLAANQGDDRGPASFGLQLTQSFLP